jgi:hypothetical protein
MANPNRWHDIGLRALSPGGNPPRREPPLSDKAKVYFFKVWNGTSHTYDMPAMKSTAERIVPGLLVVDENLCIPDSPGDLDRYRTRRTTRVEA